MGVNASTQTKLRRQAKESPVNRSIKLLLLGPGDSGKTTVYKQLRNSRGAPFTHHERAAHANGLRLNIVTGMLELIKCCKDGEEDLSDLEKQVDILNELKAEIKVSFATRILQFTDEKVEAIMALWDNPAVKKAFPIALREGRYQVQDNYKELVEKLREYPKWGGPDWEPSDDECMLWRNPTVGVNQETFRDDKKLITLIDVGGQRGERKKWVGLFSGVSGLIFVCSMSDYDQTLFEAEDVNRTVESMSVFKQVAENETFADIPIIVFFNKLDLFEDKFVRCKIPINTSGLFPTAPILDEADSSFEAAKEWYKQAFVANLEGEAAQKNYFYHFTSALNKTQLEEVLVDCTQHILRTHFSV